MPLSWLIPLEQIDPIRKRNSPSTQLAVISVEGHFLPGESGAPVFNVANRVVGIVNGGLQKGFAEVSWMIPWDYIDLKPVKEKEVRDKLNVVKTKDPHLRFSLRARKKFLLQRPSQVNLQFWYGMIVPMPRSTMLLSPFGRVLTQYDNTQNRMV